MFVGAVLSSILGAAWSQTAMRPETTNTDAKTMIANKDTAETTLRIILVGDSTMATRTGYGDALCALFSPSVECWNLARGGRSTKSFRVEGLWDEMLVRMRKAPEKSTYVLIQFGHNDQPGKAERSTDLATEFPANLRRYVTEARAVNAIPVLITPLTRRTFKQGVHQNDLRGWADSMIEIAHELRVPLVELNALSSAAVARMGTSEANTLAEEPPPQYEIAPDVKSRFDYTHLGEKGARFFAQMVLTELVRVAPPLAHRVAR
jgi:lysophospholipase L1-like esterase